jgi:hypothetical protein
MFEFIINCARVPFVGGLRQIDRSQGLGSKYKDEDIRQVHREDGEEIENAIPPYDSEQRRFDVLPPEIVGYPRRQSEN